MKILHFFPIFITNLTKYKIVDKNHGGRGGDGGIMVEFKYS